MTREEAIRWLNRIEDKYIHGGDDDFDAKRKQAIAMAIEALKMQEYDEIVFDMNEFFSIVDDGKITVMRRGRGRVTVERPAMGMETTICSYGGRSENEKVDL